MSHHLITITHNNRGGPCPLVGHGISIWGTATRNIQTCALSLPKSGLFLMVLSLPSFLKKIFHNFLAIYFFSALKAPPLRTASQHRNQTKWAETLSCIFLHHHQDFSVSVKYFSMAQWELWWTICSSLLQFEVVIVAKREKEQWASKVFTIFSLPCWKFLQATVQCENAKRRICENCRKISSTPFAFRQQ